MDEALERQIVGRNRDRIILWAVCVGAVAAFHAGRLSEPTFLGDDVIRIVDARVLPLREQLFRPFSEHVAPGFELATAALIRPLGDRIDLLPAALTSFAFAAWLVMLAAAAWWAGRISGRADVAPLVFVFVGVSSACIEVPWWFSAATYSLAAACVFAALALVAGPRPMAGARLAGIAAFTALGMSFSALGLMAVILGGLATFGRFGIRKAAIADIAALAGGFLAYSIFARIFGGEVVSTQATRFSPAGFAYALAVPGGVGLPLFAGLDVHAVTARFSYLAGSAMTVVLAMVLLRSRCSKSLKIDLAAMAIVPYLAIYPTRAALVESGAWTLPDFLYFWTSRYHLFMTAVLAVAAAAAVVRFQEIAEPRGFRIKRYAGPLVLLAYAVVQNHNAGLMRHFENQPDQAPTLDALSKLGRVAGDLRIPRAQLERLIPPVRRGWNASVLELRPDRFHHVMLLAGRGGSGSGASSEMPDEIAIRRLIERLDPNEWQVLNSRRLMNLDPADADSISEFREIRAADFVFERSIPVESHSWKILEPFGHVEFAAVGLHPESNIIFERIRARGTVHIQWTTSDVFDELRTFEFEPEPATHRPVPERIVLRPTDFGTNDGRLGGPFTVRFRIRTTQAGPLEIGRILAGTASNRFSPDSE